MQTLLQFLPRFHTAWHLFFLPMKHVTYDCVYIDAQQKQHTVRNICAETAGKAVMSCLYLNPDAVRVLKATRQTGMW